MFVPNVDMLRHENWSANDSIYKRLHALEEAENQLATAEGRSPCWVRLLDEDHAQVDENGGYIAGRHVTYLETGKEEIQINPEILYRDEPYDAVETLFHESRHAYQENSIENPESKEDPAKLQQWKENLDRAAYFSPGEEKELTLDYALYHYQPVEVDANNAAYQRMDALYQGQYHDNSGYSKYCEARDYTENSVNEYAKEVMITEQPEEVAAQAVHNAYQQKYGNSFQQQDQIPEDNLTPVEPIRESESMAEREAEAETTPLVEKSAEKETSENTESESSSETESEGEDQYYGYGY